VAKLCINDTVKADHNYLNSFAVLSDDVPERTPFITQASLEIASIVRCK
jgi:hypothetical protein